MLENLKRRNWGIVSNLEGKERTICKIYDERRLVSPLPLLGACWETIAMILLRFDYIERTVLKPGGWIVLLFLMFSLPSLQGGVHAPPRPALLPPFTRRPWGRWSWKACIASLSDIFHAISSWTLKNRTLNTNPFSVPNPATIFIVFLAPSQLQSVSWMALASFTKKQIRNAISKTF